MKSSVLLFAVVSAASVARLAAVPVSSTVTAVTVYADRAVVSRTAAVDLAAGTSELEWSNLPETLDERSLQVSGHGAASATILDVSARQSFVDFTPNARVKELEDQLHGFTKQMRGLDDRAAILQGQAAALDKIEAALFSTPAKDVPRPDLTQAANALTFLTEQRTKLSADRATLDEQRADLQGKITAAQNQLNELRGAGGRSYKSVVVRVASPQAGSFTATLSYTVPGASWVPAYDARVTSGDRSVGLDYFGIVRQNTGEDWKEVALTLSTARPGLGGAAPELAGWHLEASSPVPMRFDLSAQKEARVRAVRDEAAVAANPAVVESAPAPAPQEVSADLALATVESGTTSASFKVALPASVASDNSPQKVPITSLKFPAELEYATVPKRVATAYLSGKVQNASDFPLLAGAMNVFLDGTFVATSRLATVMAGEKFDLALGADEGISVKHRRVKKFTEDTGLTNSGKRLTYEYLLTIQNNKKVDARVVVTDQVPLSRNEKIVVKVQAPDPKEIKPTDEGLLKWTLNLKPGEKRELTVKFTVDYPNDVVVGGLD